MNFNFPKLDKKLIRSFNRVKDDVYSLMRTREEHEKLVLKMKIEHKDIFVRLNKLSNVPQRLNTTTNELNGLKIVIKNLGNSFTALNKKSLTVNKLEIRLKNVIANFNKKVVAVDKKLKSKDSASKKELIKLKSAYSSVKKENVLLSRAINKMQSEQKKINARILANLNKPKVKSVKVQASKKVVKKVSRNPLLKYELASVKGIGKRNAAKLQKIEIKNLKQLLNAGKTVNGRVNIAKDLKLKSSTILQWINRVDLMRISGIGIEYSDLLEDCGVDTVMELQNRNPENLNQTLVEVNKKRKLVKLVPGVVDIKKWIAHAKRLARAVEY
ncbi:MAG: DUF4332 domain-containing protein [archaeon]